MRFPGLFQIDNALTVPSPLEDFQVWDQAAILQGSICKLVLTVNMTLALFTEVLYRPLNQWQKIWRPDHLAQNFRTTPKSNRGMCSYSPDIRVHRWGSEWRRRRGLALAAW